MNFLNICNLDLFALSTHVKIKCKSISLWFIFNPANLLNNISMWSLYLWHSEMEWLTVSRLFVQKLQIGKSLKLILCKWLFSWTHPLRILAKMILWERLFNVTDNHSHLVIYNTDFVKWRLSLLLCQWSILFKCCLFLKSLINKVWKIMDRWVVRPILYAHYGTNFLNSHRE